MSRSTAPPRGPRRPRAAVHAPEARPHGRPLPHAHAGLPFSHATATPTRPPLLPGPRPRPARGRPASPAPRSGRAPPGHPDSPRRTSVPGVTPGVPRWRAGPQRVILPAGPASVPPAPPARPAPGTPRPPLTPERSEEVDP